MEYLTNQALLLLISWHYFFICVLPVIFAANLYFLFTHKNYAILNKRIWFCMPLIFLFSGIGFFTGISAWAMMQFAFSKRILIMIVIFLLVLIFEIKRKNKLKISRISQKGMKKYINFCIAMYAIEFIFFLLAIGILKYEIFLS